MAMNRWAELVVFAVDAQRVAVALGVVQRVVRAVELTPLPQAHSLILGLLDCQGEIIPVFNMRRRLQLPEREVDPADQFIIARTARRTVALAVDEVREVRDCAAASVTAARDILPRWDGIEGVVEGEDGMLFIQDLDQFLSLEEEQTLETALNMQGATS